MDKNKSLIYGLFLLVVALIVVLALVLSNSNADDSSQTATINNTDPTVDSVTIATSTGGVAATSVSLTENTTTDIFIHGTASDSNGCEEIDSTTVGSSWDVRFYRTSIGDETDCTATNSLSCYQDTEVDADVTGCTPGGADVDVDYEFDIALQYYTDATDAGAHAATNWTAYVGLTDDNAGTASNTATTEINTLTALDVSSPIAYGSLALGATSTEQTVTVTNTGNNDALAPTIEQAADWTCTVGSIPRGNVHYNTTAAQPYANGTAVTGVAAATGLSISKSTTGAASTEDLYTQLQVPTSGASGSCTSTLTLIAA